MVALFTIAKTWKQLVSLNRRKNKEDVAHTYNEILLSHKKEWKTATCSSMDAPRGYYTYCIAQYMGSLFCKYEINAACRSTVFQVKEKLCLQNA